MTSVAPLARASSTARAACRTMNRLASYSPATSRRRRCRCGAMVQLTVPRASTAAAAGAVGGQFQQIGCPGQFVAPEGDLTGSEAARVVLRAEQFPLPHRVVGVLHRERRPRRFGAGRAGPVGDHDVARERRHRQSVRRHVMRNQGEHVLGGAEPPQMCPYGQLHGDVEGCGRDALEALWQLRLGDVLGLEVERRIGDRTHLLQRAVGGVRKHRSQRLWRSTTSASAPRSAATSNGRSAGPRSGCCTRPIPGRAD